MTPRIGMVLPELSEKMFRLARQMGVDEVVAGVPEGESGPVYSFQGFLQQKKRFQDAGLDWTVSEAVPVPDRVILGLPGRDEDIENLMKSIRNMAAAGVTIWCYNWMALQGWIRTSLSTRVRGEALTSSYDHSLLANAPLLEQAPIAEEQLWSAMEYFLKAILPVAEEVGVKLAPHPDDPPLSPIHGIARILTSPANYQRMIDLVPSPNLGLTFCQGCFSEMCVDVPATIRHFGKQGKLFFAHFRNVRGSATNFVEIFHDEPGNADMFEAMKAYYDIGFTGPMRPDHVPTMEGDTGGHAGYTLLGRLLAVGYMRGLMEAIEKTR